MSRTPLIGSIIACGLMTFAASGQDNWPQWRGPDQTGVSTCTGLPTEWGPETNIVWKTPMPSWSGGTPIIWGDRIFITSPSAIDPEVLRQEEEQRQREQAARDQQQDDQGRRGRRGGRGGRGGGGGGFGGARNPGGNDLMLLCISRTDGSILWQTKLDDGNELHRKGNNSSPSPVTDGERVWAVTGTGMVTGLDMDGNIQWQYNLQEEHGGFGLNWGYASSPLLYDGKVIVQVLDGFRTDRPAYLIAFDGDSGEVLWRQERPTDAPAESPDAYTTPTVATLDGKEQIVISGADYVTGHDPETGAELWRTSGLNPDGRRNYRIVASPLFVDGMIYAPTRVRPLLALSAAAMSGTEESGIAWRWEDAGAPDVPTPTCDGQRFYMVNDSGMVTCLNAKTGEVIWGPERTVRGTVSSSPLLADGKLYFTNEEGVTVVLRAGDDYEMLAANELDGTYTLSSPVPSGDMLFIRTADHLYCIGASNE